jgi:SAM-dependent methyltransferase
LPPEALRKVAIGLPQPSFYAASGRVTAHRVLAAAEDALHRSPAHVVDFGCGGGRVLVHLADAWPAARFTGVDIDQRALAWCRANLACPRIRFAEGGAFPPLDLDGPVDLVVSVSVFTHLPPDMQRTWLAWLLDRVDEDGALVVTVNGGGSLPALGAEVAEVVRRSGHVYVEDGGVPGLPPWYQLAVHSEEGVRDLWGDLAEVVDYREGAVLGFQDVVILRRRDRRAAHGESPHPRATGH